MLQFGPAGALILPLYAATYLLFITTLIVLLIWLIRHWD
jgi:hypothetical protein